MTSTSRVPQTVLALTAAALAVVPWLRSFPSAVAAVPLFGAAGLSVLLPLLTRRFGTHVRRGTDKPWAPVAARFWVSLGIDLVVLLGYLIVVVLHGQGGFMTIWSGVLHGPSQVLTFALPLVSPRSLLVAPTVLIWLTGAVAGETIARRSSSVAPQCAFVISFGLAYAATLRAVSSGGNQLGDTLLAAALLGCVLALRASQVWAGEPDPESAEERAGGLRRASLAATTAAGTAVTALVVALVSVHSGLFPADAKVPERTPSIQNSNPLNPVAFVADLRQSQAGSASKAPGLFTVSTDEPAPGYFELANVDTYDGAGWSFTRSFLPSGGVLPADTDPGLAGGLAVDQDYRIMPGPLTGAPWLPLLDRAQNVSGLAVNIDPASGMVVPAGGLPGRVDYSARSTVSETLFDALDPTRAQADAATPGVDVQLPPTLRTTVNGIADALAAETGVALANPIQFLQAVQRDFRNHYALAAPNGLSASGSSTPATPAAEQAAAERAGGTGFSDVLASILGAQRTATPEQYATLIVLLARDLGVPARVVTGFRVPPPNGAKLLPANTYTVTAEQAWSWAEVAISGVGWVVLDPSPTTVRSVSPDQPSGGAATPTTSAPPTGNALITRGNNGNAVGKSSQVPHDTSAPQLTLLAIVIIGVGVCVLAGLLVLGTRKRLRAARRRRYGSTRQVVSAAWTDALDRLYEAGLGDGPAIDAMTSSEVTDLTEEQFGPDAAWHADVVGTAAEAAAYRQSTAMLASDVETAWQAHHDLIAAVNDALGARGRLRAFLRYRYVGHRH